MKNVKIPAEQSRAEQSRAEQSRAEQSRAEQSRAEQSRAEQSRAEAKFKNFGKLSKVVKKILIGFVVSVLLGVGTGQAWASVPSFIVAGSAINNSLSLTNGQYIDQSFTVKPDTGYTITGIAPSGNSSGAFGVSFNFNSWTDYSGTIRVVLTDTTTNSVVVDQTSPTLSGVDRANVTYTVNLPYTQTRDTGYSMRVYDNITFSPDSNTNTVSYGDTASYVKQVITGVDFEENVSLDVGTYDNLSSTETAAQTAATDAQAAQAAAVAAQAAANNVNTIANNTLTVSAGVIQDSSGTVLTASRAAQLAANTAATNATNAYNAANSALSGINTANTNLSNLQSSVSSIQSSVTNITNYLPPTLNKVSGYNGATATSATIFKVALDFSNATDYQYQVDGGAWSSWGSLSGYNGYVTVSGLSTTGMHTITVKVRNGSTGPTAQGSMTVFKL